MIDFKSTYSSSGTMDTEDVLSIQRYTKPMICGVYFLIKNEEVVYVGQSVEFLRRIHEHYGKVDFDSFSFIECNMGDLRAEETKYILKYLPKYNKDAGRLTELAKYDLYSKGEIRNMFCVGHHNTHIVDDCLSEIKDTIDCFVIKLYRIPKDKLKEIGIKLSKYSGKKNKKYHFRRN